MRPGPRAVVLLLTACVLAGCLESPPEPDQGDDVPTEEARRQTGGARDDGNGSDPPHDVVPLLEEPFEAVGSTQRSFDVQVPENVANVDFQLSFPGPVHERIDLKVSLSGCGEALDTTVSGVFGSGGTVTMRLCKAPTAGPQTATVSVSGFVQGTVRLMAQDPHEGASMRASSTTGTAV